MKKMMKMNAHAQGSDVDAHAQKSLISELQTKVRQVNDAKNDEKAGSDFVNDQMDLSATY